MLGDNIQRIRKEKGLTLPELAEKANIAKSYLSSIERNLQQNPSIQVVVRISLALQVDISTLLDSEIEGLVPLVEEEWIRFIHELKEEGIGIEDIRNHNTIIEFLKWCHSNKNKENRK